MKRVSTGVVEASDGIAVVATKRCAGNRADRVLVEGIAICIERARDDVDALHAVAAGEADRAANGDGVGRSDLLAGKSGQVRRSDGIDAAERGDVVVAQNCGIGNALRRRLRRRRRSRAASRASLACRWVRRW